MENRGGDNIFFWNFRQVRQEGTGQVTREIPYYNLDMIISLGYKIKSLIATRFRKWATERLKEYMVKGFTMDIEYFFPAVGAGDYDCLYIFVYYLLLYGFKTSWYNITIISSIVMRS